MDEPTIPRLAARVLIWFILGPSLLLAGFACLAAGSVVAGICWAAGFATAVELTRRDRPVAAVIAGVALPWAAALVVWGPAFR